MYRKILFSLILSSVPISCLAATMPASPIKHVIYITMDGTRWQDIMRDKTYFPLLWGKHVSGLEVYGAVDGGRVMEVASIPVSLPSYQSQMTGTVQPCKDNKCGRVKAKTLPENILATRKLHKKDVAVFSGWPEVGYAAESKSGRVYVNVGNIPVVDPVSGKPDNYMAQINALQTKKSHAYGNRMDEYTFKQAMHYFHKYKPVFLWISLVNADNEAHMGHLRTYQRVLVSYDKYLDQVFRMLKAEGLDKNTMVIVTTDHGRGDGDNWTTHGEMYPEAKRTWAFVKNGELQPVSPDAAKYSTLSIRPTIEKALGIKW